LRYLKSLSARFKEKQSCKAWSAIFKMLKNIKIRPEMVKLEQKEEISI
jgi:hypothetical protein